MDRAKCATIRAALDVALAKLGEELGLAVKTVGGGTFTSTSLTLKVEIAEVGQDGSVLSQEAQAYKQLGHIYGLPAATLGWTFTQGGRVFTIRGLNTRSYKMPIICSGLDEKKYKFAPETVKALLASQHSVEWDRLFTIPATTE